MIARKVGDMKMHGAFHLNRPCVARLSGLNSILKPSPIVVQEPTSSDGGTCCSLSLPHDDSFPRERAI
jgi:hypothetical protein